LRNYFLVLVFLLANFGMGQSQQPSSLTSVHFINVGQGDSILIHSAQGTSVLIDGGYDNGLALAYLQAQGVTRLDAVFASHPHADHIGGLVSIMNTIPTLSVWTSGASHTTATFERFLDVIEAKQIPYFETNSGDHILIGDLQFDVLYARRQASDLNNTSLVLRLNTGEISFLFTGDAEAPVEQELIQTIAPELFQSTVLKVGHHGSASSSTANFLAAVQPRIAIYSAGQSNSYGHPHRRTLENLQAVAATIYGTDRDGTIVVSTDGIEIDIQTKVQSMELLSSSEAPVIASTAAPQGTEIAAMAYDVNGPDRDCGGFDSQAEAQAFFEAAGGPRSDPHRLDGDNDGIACESLP
jgi:competence protein ComEC